MAQLTEYEALEKYLNDSVLRTPPVKSQKYPKGKAYDIESPDAETGIYLASLANLATRAAVAERTGKVTEMSEEQVRSLQLNDTDEKDFNRRVLGGCYQEMLDDGVPWVSIQRLAQYAFAYFSISENAAERVVTNGLGKGAAPANREERRASKKKSSSGARSGRPASAGSKNLTPTPTA